MRQFFRFFDLVCEETTPNRVAGGLVLGLTLGMFPLLSSQTVFLLLLASIIRVQLPSVVVGWLLGAMINPFLDPIFNETGLFLLKSATLRGTWSYLYHSPLIPFTRFNNSVIFGVHVLALIVAPALFFALSYVLGHYWPTLVTRVMYTPVWIRWQTGAAARYYREYRESLPKTAPTEATSHRGKFRRRFLRLQGWPYFAGSGLVTLLVLWFGKEAFLRQQIEGIASRMNGARVEVGSVEIHPFSGELILRDVQIGNPYSPSRNLFEIERARLAFSSGPLVRRKFIVEKCTIEGMQLDTERAQSALLGETDLNQSIGGLFDRSATGYYADVRSVLKTNPLKYLGSLSSGLSLNPRIDQIRTQLETLQSLEKQDHEIEALSARWEGGKLALPASDWMKKMRERLQAIDVNNHEAALKDLSRVRGEIASSISTVTEIAASMSESIGNVQRGIASLTPTLDTDIARVKEALRLPDFSMEDMSPQLFGGQVLGALERMAYWTDLSRRRMPKGDAKEKMTLVMKNSGRGTDVIFANRSGSPELLIQEVEFVPTPEARAKNEGVTGKIYGLTSEPSFYQYPAGATIDVHLPAQHIEHVKLSVVVDHAGIDYKESLAFQAQALPLNRLMLHDTSSLSLSIDHSSLFLTLTANFVEQQVRADWAAQIDNAQYGVISRFLPEETTLKRILNPIQSVHMSGEAEGPADQLGLKIQSNLGKLLAAGLRQEFRHALGAIDDNIRRNILDRAEPTRRALASRLGQLRQGALQTVSRSLKDLQDLASEADTLRGRLENPKAKPTASRIRPRK